ncbi:MAG: TonB-dependent receptor [Alphaproteobacteria bacterium]
MAKDNSALVGSSLTALIAVMALGVASEARAQSAAPVTPATEAAGGMEDVIVTARKRAENLQDVPLTISAFSRQDMDRWGARSLSDIAQLTPGVNFESYAAGGYPALTIRGVSQTNILAFEGNVSTFFGGIYLPRTYMFDPGLMGLERVEVVKGPQSALYGRNAFAGAINYVPLAPSATPTIDLSVTSGTDELFGYNAMLGGGALDGKVKLLAGLNHSEFDGTWTNTRPGVNSGVANGTSGKMGGYDNDTYFVSLGLEPTSRASITLNWVRSDKDSEAQGRYGMSRNTGQTNCSLIGGVYQFYCGELPVLPSNIDPRSQGLHARTEISRAVFNYQFTDEISASYMFGRVISSAYSFDQTSINSVTGDTPAGMAFLGQPIGSNQSNSHEARLDWDHGSTKASAGVFYSSLDDEYKILSATAPPGGFTPLTPSTTAFLAQSQFSEVTTKSAFAQISQDFLDAKFNIALEARYTKETKELYDQITFGRFSADFNYFTPRAVAKWNFTPDNNAYVSAAKGVKSGGFNSGTILPSERVFDPESNWTYEIGTKNDFLNRRVQLNASAFYTDWSNLQTVSVSGNPAFTGTLTRNVGEAKVYGAEFEGRAMLTEGLQAAATFTYTHPTYGDGIIDPRYLC